MRRRRDMPFSIVPSSFPAAVVMMGMIFAAAPVSAAAGTRPSDDRAVAAGHLPADIDDLPIARVAVDCGSDQGPLEIWRHALGHGGINPHPLPDRVVRGVKQLRP